MANEHPSQLGHRVTALEERLRALQQERLAADEACYSGDFSRKASHDKDLKDLQDAHKKDAEKHEKAMSALRDRHARKYKRRVARAEKAFESLRGRSMRERQNQANLDRQKLQEAEERIVAEEKQKTDLLSEQHDDLVARIGTMREKAGVLKGRVESLAVSFGEGLPDLEAPLPQKEGEWGDPLPFVDGLAERLSEAGLLYRRVNDGLLSSLGKRIWTLVAFLLIGLGHVVALVFIVQRSQPPVYIPYLIGSALVSILLLHFLTRAMRLKACRAVRKLYEDLRDILASLVRQEQVEKDRFWSQSKNLMDERIARVLKFEEGINAESAGFFKQNEQLLADFRARFQRLLDRNKAKEERARAELEAVIAEKNRKFEQEHEGACKKRQDQYKNDQGGAESKRANVARRAQAGWKEGLEVFAREMREALTVASATHSSWEALAAEATRMPAAFPREVMLGQVALPLKKLDVSENADFPLPELTAALPLSLVFPGAGSLLVQAGAAGRDRALHALFASALRILASFPRAWRT
ncbi:MAG: hypothetical protein M5U26_15995 [Planctomycetota bacterium]|nr:hypothetical protein [Planctomycetota bacterium]